MTTPTIKFIDLETDPWRTLPADDAEALQTPAPYRIFTLAQWLEADGVDLARIPKVVDHRRRMSERPSVRTAIAQEFAP